MKKKILIMRLLIFILALSPIFSFAAPSPPTNLQRLGSAGSFIFQWTANDTADNVDLYRIYWSTDYGLYDDPADPNARMKIVDDFGGPGVIYETVYPDTIDDIQYDIPDITESDIACFTATAADIDGNESNYADQVCYGPMIPPFIIIEADYSSYDLSGWAYPNAVVYVYLDGDINYLGSETADQYGAWTITDLDFSAYPEGEILLYAVSNDKQSPITAGIMDSVTAKFSAGPGTLDITNNTATIMWSTSEPTRTVLEYRTADASLPPEEQIDGQLINNNLIVDHSMVISGLPPATTFYYSAKATDAAGNELLSSEKAFKTSSGPDVTFPRVSLPVIEQVNSDTSATISWNVDELSNSTLEYGTTSGVYSMNVIDSGVGNRTKALTDLEASTLYYFRVQATDTSGNGPTISVEQSFTTLDTPKTTPPVIDETTIDIEVDHRSATITWETDEFSDSTVEYGLTPSYGQTENVDTDVTEHSVRLVALHASTTYYFRVNSTDIYDNGPANSTGKSFTTLPSPDVTLPEFNSPPTVNVTDTTATITWTTNEDSHSSVHYGTQSSTWNNYPSSKDEITLKVAHSVTLTDLLPNTSHYYRVGIIDGSNNGPTVSPQYSFLTESLPDTLAPLFEKPPTITGKTDTRAVIAWSTDEESTSLVRFGTNPPYDSWENYPESLNNADLVRNHLVTLTNLTPNTLYCIRVGSVDGLDNGPSLSQEIKFRTDGAVVADERPRVTVPPTVTGITNTSVIIEWQTDEPANGEVRFGTYEAPNWESYPEVVIDNRTDTNHSVVLNNLSAESRYYFRVGSTDAAGNGPNTDPYETNNPFSEDIFITLVDPDTKAPQIISGPFVAAVDTISAIITWETDEPSNTLVQYGTSGTNWQTLSSSTSDGDMVTQHSVTLTNLSPTTVYYFAVGSQDRDGNGPFVNGNATNPSAVAAFTTTGSVDTAVPVISNVTMSFATDTTALITWTTDEPSNSIVQYDTVSQGWGVYAYEEGDDNMKTNHSVTIINLQPNTIYYFRVASIDAKGNGPMHSVNDDNPSMEFNFMTDEFPDTIPIQMDSDVTISVNVEKLSAVVNWQTHEEPGNSQVKYDFIAQNWGDYSFAENDAGMERNHSVTLTNLKVDKVYYLRVSSVDASGNDLIPSSEYNFVLGSSVGTGSTLFGIIADSISGVSISGAKIYSSHFCMEKILATSRDGGAYSIPDHPSGKYLFAVKAEGYKTQVKESKLENLSLVSIDFELIPGPGGTDPFPYSCIADNSSSSSSSLCFINTICNDCPQ